LPQFLLSETNREPEGTHPGILWSKKKKKVGIHFQIKQMYLLRLKGLCPCEQALHPKYLCVFQS